MITDADIKRMKVVFATKDDFKIMVRLMERKFIGIEKRLSKTVTYDYFNKAIKDLTKLIQIGFNLENKASTRLNGHDNILNKHERRLERVEGKTTV